MAFLVGTNVWGSVCGLRRQTRAVGAVTLITTLVAILALGAATSQTASAQRCGEPYTIKAGETLADIAARTYGEPSRWTIIFYANQDRIGQNASLLVPGLEIRLPCIGGARPPARARTQQASPQPTPGTEAAAQRDTTADDQQRIVISSLLRRVEFLTADDYAPFTGRGLEGGGMMPDLLTQAMGIIQEESKGRLGFGISWVNDWSAHLDPLLSTRAFDVGFPWIRPNCEDQVSLDRESRERCSRFFFSEPLFEFMLQVFVRANSDLNRLTTDAVRGRTFCRPQGYSLHAFEANGRFWIRDNVIQLLQPAAVDDCFRLLADGTIDGVVMNEFVGLTSVNSLGLRQQVRALNEPLALLTLHALVAKTHPQARTILYYVNAAVRRLRAEGRYDQTVEKHLKRFWDAQSNQPDPALANAPATGPAQDDAASPAAVTGALGGDEDGNQPPRNAAQQ